MADEHTLTPFTLHIDDSSLRSLTERLRSTRWPAEDPRTGWDDGLPLEYARELATYWAEDFNWRAQEARINSVPQFTTPIDGHDVHFFHVRSEHPSATPLLLIHGWPGQPTEFLPMIEALTAPQDPHAAAFHIVAPTIPGFGVSGPTVGWDTDKAARAFATLLSRLGYAQYMVHGYDTGAMIARSLGLTDGEHVLGVHVTQVLGGESLTYETADMSDPAEARAVQNAMRYEHELGGYALVQSTRPQSLAYALTDSPVGLMAWLVERYKDWSAAQDAPEEVIPRDELLTHLSIYWHCATIGSSMRYYKSGNDDWGAEPQTLSVPMAVCVLPQDIGAPVRRIVERTNNVVRWSELDAGGHFAGWEQPVALVEDIRAAQPVLAATAGQ